MKKIEAVLVLYVLLLVANSCYRIKPGAGEEAVMIEKPFFFGDGGVDPAPVRSGSEWVAATTDYTMVDMKPLQFEEKFDDLMSSDGVPLDFDAFIRLRVTDSVKLVSKFGKHWYENNIRTEFRNRVRQAVRKHGLNETAIDTTAIEAIDQEVTNGMVAMVNDKPAPKDNDVEGGMIGYLKSADLPVELIGITVGKANPPDSVKDQRVATASQQQRALTERERKLAEDARLDAETSRALADNAYRNSMGLTTDMFIQLEQIKMLHEVCAKGDGHCTFLVGQTAVAPVVNISK
jgi:regulator of protease activity HflC (stomatin/prohibitin superfamily)